MFDTLLIITLFLLASLLVCLLTLRLSINIKTFRFMSPFSFITYIKGFFEIPTLSTVYFDLPRLLNLTKISDLLPRLF